MKNGNYNKVEQEFVDTIRNVVNKEVAKNSMVNISEATRDAILNYSEWADPWNPLYSDPEYAKNTSYGKLPAPPHFLEVVNSLTVWPPHPAEGFMDHDYAGDYMEYKKPILVGDTFTLTREENLLEEISEELDDENRHFAFTSNRSHVMNQTGEEIGFSEQLVSLTLREKPSEMDLDKFPFGDHVYTQEEWEYINQVIANEKIRGSETRYWEDVQLNEELPAVTIGPTTIWDMVAFFAARHEVPFHPSRFFRNLPNADVIADERTNNTFVPFCWHFNNDRAKPLGFPRAFNFGGSAAAQLMRLATNWCGDDGRIKILNWRHVLRTPHGDCTVGYGKVIRKYEKDGEYLVDVLAFLLNQCRGNLSEVATITIALPARSGAKDLEKQFGEIDVAGDFRRGDKVKIARIPKYHFPTGYPLEGAEGVVEPKFSWQAADFHRFGGYTSIQITKCDQPLTLSDRVMVPTELLEKI
ncbi:MAG: MaoC family dehydratase N-terminal domain-containing protein [Clostridiales bacterium]|nr:MaoC family dehydratase N-terminal domain-containing protein [Clostridiales bacterium]